MHRVDVSAVVPLMPTNVSFGHANIVDRWQTDRRKVVFKVESLEHRREHRDV